MEFEQLIDLLKKISDKLDKIIENQEQTDGQIALASYMQLASSLIVEVEKPDGTPGHGLDEEALDKAYENLQDNFAKLQEKP